MWGPRAEELNVPWWPIVWGAQVIKHKQKFLHDPTNGVWGDCHRAAIASVMGLPLETVPHFGDGGPSDEEFMERERIWLLKQGLVRIMVWFACELPDVFAYQAKYNPGIYYLLGGTSRTGVDHTVVCLDGEIVHDPSQNESGIVGKMSCGFYGVTHFGSAIAKHNLGTALREMKGK